MPTLLGKPALTNPGSFPSVNNVLDLNVQRDFPVVFRGHRKLQQEYEIVLKPDASPFALTSPRRIPLPLYRKTRTELQRIQEVGLSTAATQPTGWCTPMVVVRKPLRALRICVDYTEQSKFTTWVASDLGCAAHPWHAFRRRMVLVNQRNLSFLQIPQSERSQLITSFITPLGHFCLNRLPFGFCSAPEPFQRRTSDILQGLDGVASHTDDILIWG